MRRSLMTVGVAMLTMVAAASCTTTGPGNPTATTSTGVTSTADQPPTNLNGAPHVVNPLDTSKFQSQPCSSITSAQLAALNIGTTSKTSNVGGPTCDWGSNTDPSLAGATVGYLTAGSGLSSIYGQKSTYAVFTVLPSIEGYPAVFAAAVDQRSTGDCSIAVGVSDRLVVAVSLSENAGQYKTDPCTPNTQLAADVISNIKNGGS